MAKRHVVISGTGRAGTSFLVQLLTRLGFDTGYDPATFAVLPAAIGARRGLDDWSDIARAGLELEICHPDAPYIIKTPYLCGNVDEVIASGVQIEHAIIPVRAFAAAAASRLHVQLVTTGAADGDERVPGGLWDTSHAVAQRAVLHEKFATLVEALVRNDVPTTFVSYPRVVQDWRYVYSKLRFLLGPVTEESFESVFRALVRPDWVHDFGSAQS